MKRTLYIVFFILNLALSSCQTQYLPVLTSDDHRIMKEEADHFLQQMPTDLQQRQTAAIMQAIGGNPIALQDVRHARNTPPDSLQNVTWRMLTPTLRLYEPAKSTSSLPLLIYLHGGGWTFGSPNSCARFCQAMAATGKMKVLAVDYRLAPEHPFPTALTDCQAAVRLAHAMAQTLGIDAARITLGGDSSGGNLALATALTDECHGMLESLVVFYPVTKAYADHSASWQQYAAGYALDADLMSAFNRAYVGNYNEQDALISPANCQSELLARLPRTLLIAAGRDILCDQGSEFAQRASRHNRLTRVEFTNAVHLFITVPGQEHAFSKAVELTTQFVDVD